jgi:hypothetical protein
MDTWVDSDSSYDGSYEYSFSPFPVFSTIDFPISPSPLQEICEKKIIENSLNYEQLPKAIKEKIEKKIKKLQDTWEEMWKSMLDWSGLPCSDEICQKCNREKQYSLENIICYNCKSNKFLKKIKDSYNVDIKKYFICDYCNYDLSVSDYDFRGKNMAICMNIKTLEKICVDCRKILWYPFDGMNYQPTEGINYKCGYYPYVFIEGDLLRFYYSDI